MDWEIFSRYVIPAIIGGVAGLISNSIQWLIEKKRARLQYRQALIASWRNNLVPGIENDVSNEFVLSTEYASLRAHLSPDLVKQIETRKLTLYLGQGALPPLRRRIIEEIARIERKWGLV